VNINDVLYFAPGIPYNKVDWGTKELPDQFCCRIEGFYLDPATYCLKAKHAFAAGLLLVGCIDSMSRLKYRDDSVERRFTKFLKSDLHAFKNNEMAQRFYKEIRNGLVHEARLKNGAQFTLDSTEETVVDRGDILLVNPKLLLTEVRNALSAYVEVLKVNSHELKLLSSSLTLDLEKDILAANQYGTQ
jgi:hypothetical protein